MNTNGVISFDAAVSTVIPQSFPLSGLFLIAPYWADVDTNGTGTVYNRETQDNDVLRRARNDVMTSFSRRFLPIFVFIATWDRVGHTGRVGILKKSVFYITIVVLKHRLQACIALRFIFDDTEINRALKKSLTSISRLLSDEVAG